MAPAIQETHSLAIWFSPHEHALTILDEKAEVVAGEIYFAGGLADPLIEGLPTLLQESTRSNPALGFLFEQQIILAQMVGTRETR